MGTGDFSQNIDVHRIQQFRNLGRDIDRNVFIREINGHLKQSGRADQFFAPDIDLLTQVTGQNAQGLFSLRFGLCLDEVAQAFNLREIQLAILHRTAGKFARLGKARAVKTREQRQYRTHHRDAPMQMKLDRVFAGKAVRTFESQDKGTINHLPIGVTNCAHRGHPRGGQRLRDGFSDEKRLRARDTNDANTGPPLRCGLGEYRIHII